MAVREIESGRIVNVGDHIGSFPEPGSPDLPDVEVKYEGTKDGMVLISFAEYSDTPTGCYRPEQFGLKIY